MQGLGLTRSLTPSCVLSEQIHTDNSRVLQQYSALVLDYQPENMSHLILFSFHEQQAQRELPQAKKGKGT